MVILEGTARARTLKFVPIITEFIGGIRTDNPEWVPWLSNSLVRSGANAFSFGAAFFDTDFGREQEPIVFNKTYNIQFGAPNDGSMSIAFFVIHQFEPRGTDLAFPADVIINLRNKFDGTVVWKDLVLGNGKITSASFAAGRTINPVVSEPIPEPVPEPTPEPEILSKNFEIEFTDPTLASFTTSLSPSNFAVLQGLEAATNLWSIVSVSDSFNAPKESFKEIIDFINLALAGLTEPKEGLDFEQKAAIVLTGIAATVGIAGAYFLHKRGKKR